MLHRFLVDSCGIQARAGSLRAWVDEHLAVYYPRAKRGDLLGKRRRRGAGLRQVLVAMPGTSDATIHDAALAERTVLMTAHIRDGGYFALISEDGDAFSGQGHHHRPVFGNAAGVAGFNEAVTGWLRRGIVYGALAPGGGEVQDKHGEEAGSERCGHQGTGFRLQRSERDV